MNDDKEQNSLTIENLRISTRFNHVIFPLDMAELAKHLERMGYTMLAPTPPPSPGAIEKKGYTGPFARKENTIIDSNSDRQFIGITDPNLDNLLSRHEELSRILADESNIGCKLMPYFTEFHAHFKYLPKDDVFDILSHIGEQLPAVNKAADILGTPLAIRTLRVSSQNTSIDSRTYSELVIEPAPCNERHMLEILIVSRNPDSKIIIDLVRSVRERLSKYLQTYTSH